MIATATLNTNNKSTGGLLGLSKDVIFQIKSKPERIVSIKAITVSDMFTLNWFAAKK